MLLLLFADQPDAPPVEYDVIAFTNVTLTFATLTDVTLEPD
jgi:hypothetical protein